jgi:hypothetical protein
MWHATAPGIKAVDFIPALSEKTAVGRYGEKIGLS